MFKNMYTPSFTPILGRKTTTSRLINNPIAYNARGEVSLSGSFRHVYLLFNKWNIFPLRGQGRPLSSILLVHNQTNQAKTPH